MNKQRPMRNYTLQQLLEIVESIPKMPEWAGDNVDGFVTLEQMTAKQELELRQKESSLIYGDSGKLVPNDGRNLSRAQRLIQGYMDVSELTNEELARKTTMSSNGKFAGRRPNFPERILIAMEREYLRRFEDSMRALVAPALKTVEHIMKESDKDAVRLAASQMVFDRVIGKVPEKMQVDQTITAHSVVENRIRNELAKVLSDGELDDVVDAELADTEPMWSQEVTDATLTGDAELPPTTVAGELLGPAETPQSDVGSLASLSGWQATRRTVGNGDDNAN